MSDVAAVAGVSHQTVSRVLNDHPSVRPETRQRVLDAIATLGYRRNTAARALVTRRTGTIGVVTSGSALFGPTSTLIAVEVAARDAGLFVSVATVAQWTEAQVAAVLEHFMSQGVDGVVVIAAHDDAVEAVRTFDEPVPIVMVGPKDLPGPLHSVAVDQYAGGRMAVRHLLDLGHRTVQHLAGPVDWLDARWRIEGWRDELAAAGVVAGDPIIGDWSAARGYDVGRELVTGDLPTAVFAANDQLALGLLRAFAEAGVRVPGEVSVVGFDDVDGSAHFYPPLTTVRQEFGALGRRCMEVLLEAIAGGTTESGLIAPSVVVRASSGPPRA
jgi:DNA-binding LacI/PurR family transcriptional regulator